ncbi:electron transfer flavoprotein subunit beta/FixA family protein [Leucobacter sp. W1478]|uniref:electron transfer flavoprotein subunit beta/FixA family protein n=1 Tax=Leucobacter sp. W1478 TaxID=3439065 RepID=UPI003F2BE72C
MRIVVLVKEVPDTYGKRKLSLETGIADRGASDAVLDEIGERALEAALVYADTHPEAEVTILSMAPEGAQSSLRKGLAMGAARAVQVADPGLAGADAGLTAATLAAALRSIGFDLVIAGDSSTDGSAGVIPAMLAELLEVPNATALSQLTIAESGISGTRRSDDAILKISAPLPVVASITEALPSARFPNFKGIMAAKKKPFTTLTLADLEIDPEDLSVPRSIMISVNEKPPRASGTKITDNGDAGTQLAEFLLQNELV